MGHESRVNIDTARLMHKIEEDLNEEWIHEGIERLQQFLDVRAAFNDFFNHFKTDDE